MFVCMSCTPYAHNQSTVQGLLVLYAPAIRTEATAREISLSTKSRTPPGGDHEPPCKYPVPWATEGRRAATSPRMHTQGADGWGGASHELILCGRDST